MSVSQIQAFKSADGQLFEMEEDALAHDQKFLLEQNLDGFFVAYGFTTFEFDGHCIQLDQVLENLDELRNILRLTTS